MRSTVVALAALSLSAAAVAAPAPVTLHPGVALPAIANLAPGSRTYLRYRIVDGKVTMIDHQTKTIAFEDIGSARVMVVRQRWQSATGTLDLVSRVDPRTLKPIDHRRTRVTPEKTIVEQFTFAGGRVRGTAAARDGTLSPLDINARPDPYNFEIDLETLAALRWGPGISYLIPFYHPGGPAPKLYRFVMSGEKTLTVGGSELPVRVVTTDYGNPEKPPARFLIAKRGGAVLRYEQDQDGGGMLVKSLLAGTDA